MKNYLLAIFLFVISTNIKSQCSVTTQPVEDCSYGDQIGSFVLNNISAIGNSGCSTGGYGSFSTPVWTLQQGSSYTYSAAVGSAIYYEAFAIWIDYNNNSIYEATEQVISSSSNYTHSGSFTVPNTALAGANHRMRIRCAYGSTLGGTTIANTDACVSGLGLGYGETEDYYVTIICNPTPSIPTLTITASNTLVCLGGTLNLTASGATTYTWSGGVTNGTTFVATALTSYTVTGNLGGCPSNTATAVKNISVTSTPLAISVAVAPSTLCAGTTVTLTGSGATNYTWMPGSLTGSVVFVSPTSPVTYTAIGNSGACPGVTLVPLNVNPSPTLSAVASSSSVCSGLSVSLTANGATNYTWTPGGTGQTVVDYPLVATAYVVLGSNTFGCIGSTSQVVLVQPSPTVVTSANKLLSCSGNSVTLTAGGAGTYSWVGGPTSNTWVVTPTVTTTYTVSGISLVNFCPDTRTITITVFIPSITVSGSVTICNGSTATLTATGANSLSWTPAVTVLGTSALASPSVSTLYFVNSSTHSLSVTCPKKDSIQVNVNPNPTVTAVPHRTYMCVKETNTLTASGAVTYTWSNSTVNANIVLTPTNTTGTSYTVTGTDNNGCTSSTVIVLKANSCNGISEQSNKGNNEILIYPNPNSGEFTIQSASDIRLTLTNELGQVIKTIDLSAQNNYSVSVTTLANGIYFITGENQQTKINRKIIVLK